MGKYKMVRTEFWRSPFVLEDMTWEERYFYLYLLTNPQTSKNGIYQVTINQMAQQLGYSIESVQALIKRFMEHHKLIRYDSETSEIVINNWGEYNKYKGGVPAMDGHHSELKEPDPTTGEEW